MKKKSIQLEINEDTLKSTFNSLPKGLRIRLISELARRLADDLRGNPEGEAFQRWFLIETEGGYGESMWSEELEDEYAKENFSAVEELCFDLYGLQHKAKHARRELIHKRNERMRLASLAK